MFFVSIINYFQFRCQEISNNAPPRIWKYLQKIVYSYIKLFNYEYTNHVRNINWCIIRRINYIWIQNLFYSFCNIFIGSWTFKFHLFLTYFQKCNIQQIKNFQLELCKPNLKYFFIRQNKNQNQYLFLWIE